MLGMAHLIPHDLDLHDLHVTAEREVVRLLVERLPDSWVVVPNVRVKVDHADAEIDVVVADPTRGAVLLEIKGGPITVLDGVWYQYDRRLKKSPDEQVMKAKHALVSRLRSMKIDLNGIRLVDTVCLPSVRNVPESGVGAALPRGNVIDGTDLDDPTPAVEALLPDHAPIPLDRFEAFLAALKPTVVLDGREGRASPAALRLLDDATNERLDALRALGDNARVVVTGGPGTGKTWLVLDWTRRAVERGDRTAVICFNRPIANQLAQALGPLDGAEGLVVDTYHSLVMDHLLPEVDFGIPERPGQEYWDHEPTRILMDRLGEVSRRFDTFIVDEGQDLRPQWLDSLEALLDPTGPRRILMTADTEQMIYVDADQWKAPGGFVELPLGTNVRACRHVAAVIERLGGPSSLTSAPAGMASVLLPSGPRETTKSVRRRVRELVEDFGVPHSEILVIATTRDARNAVLGTSDDDVTFVPWEERAEGAVICETVHRTKGLEATAVVLVAPEDEPKSQLVYIGVSRAIWSLSLVGPPALGELTGVRTG
jgi:hypothetical protein